ncbi:MAG: DUF58 domain-containing protein [Candidatus Chromulinivorax sp.]
MLSPEVLKKIKEIRIITRKVMNGTLVGGHITRQKGFGFEFDQLRAYEYGDDIRFMDWKSTARTGKLLVRQYLDEKNRTIMICLDVSSSTVFGSGEKLAVDIMQQVAGIMTCVAEFDQDNIGLILFSDRIERFIAPGRGHKHIAFILDAIFSYQRTSAKKTDFNIMIRYLLESFTQQAAVIMISDFIADDFQESFKQLVCKREVIVMRCLDSMLYQLPRAGYVWTQDPETGDRMLLNFSSSGINQLQGIVKSRLDDQNELFKKYKIDCLDVSIEKNFIKDIILFFKKRMVVS